MKVTANAQRSGDWWAINVPEVDGVFTQAKRLDQIPAQVADAVATMLGDVEAADVQVEVQPILDGALADKLDALKVLTGEVDRKQQRASSDTRALVRELRAQDLNTRDVGVILGVSHQRVAQLEKSPA